MESNNMFSENNVRYLYKYLPYSEGSLEVLKSGTLKYTCPLEFNDPFDCSPVYNQEAIDQLPNTRPDLFDKVIKISGQPPRKIEENFSKVKKQIVNGSLHKKTLKNIGIVSLSKNPYNILMWSHYAENHTGFVVGFRIPIKVSKSHMQQIDTLFVPLVVNYSEKRPVDNYGIDSKEDTVKKILLTKAADWKYEEEERVMDIDVGPGVYDYPRNDILASVITGTRMPENHKDNIKNILNEIQPKLRNNVKLFEAEESKTEYKIIIPDFNF